MNKKHDDKSLYCRDCDIDENETLITKILFWVTVAIVWMALAGGFAFFMQMVF